MKLVYKYIPVAIFLIFKPLQFIFNHYNSRITTAIRGL